MKQLPYKDARLIMKPGDVMAFSGDNTISNIIKTATFSNVSHVGVVLQTNIPTLDGRFINQVIESAGKKDGTSGVHITRISSHIQDYDGKIWILPLNKKFDQGTFFSFLLDQVGKKYDAPQAIGSAIDFIPDNKEDLDKLFCSELVAAAYEYTGIIGSINASEQTPADICKLSVFDEPYQVKGKPKELFRI